MVGQMLGLFKSLDLGLKPDEPSAPISSGRITLLAGVGLPSHICIPRLWPSFSR